MEVTVLMNYPYLESYVIEIKNGLINKFTINPAAFNGITTHPFGESIGGDSKYNASELTALLSGKNLPIQRFCHIKFCCCNIFIRKSRKSRIL